VRRLIVEEVALAANSVNEILDKCQVLGNRRNRRQWLNLAALASIRGLRVLSEEPFVTNTAGYLNDLAQQYNFNSAAMREDLRQSTVRLRLFLEAECRLLGDLGLSDAAVGRVRLDLIGMIMSGPERPDNLPQVLSHVIAALEQDARGQGDDRDQILFRKLLGVVEALGGALIVGVNAAVGAAGAPVTGGLSTVGAAVSGVFGTEMFSRGAKRALDEGELTPVEVAYERPPHHLFRFE
jgi:hypothetical protein